MCVTVAARNRSRSARCKRTMHYGHKACQNDRLARPHDMEPTAAPARDVVTTGVRQIDVVRFREAPAADFVLRAGTWREQTRAPSLISDRSFSWRYLVLGTVRRAKA